MCCKLGNWIVNPRPYNAFDRTRFRQMRANLRMASRTRQTREIVLATGVPMGS